jgi:alcohol dehydrogenase
MIPFDFQPRTRIVFGADKIDELGRLAFDLGARRALVVSDAGVIETGHTQRGLDALQDAGLDTAVFQDFRENPTTEDVQRGAELAVEWEPDLLIGLGGGSSLDCAKGINFVYSNGGRMQDYWGVDKASLPMLPMIAVPTTAGTGSETQSFALISDAETHVKMACGDKKAACRIAVLDPQLTVTQPRRVTALTGIDALAHTLETQVTKPRNLISQTFSREAWRLLAANYVAVLDDTENLEARSGMQLGACFAGLAIENSMLGAAHALANPLTAAYNIVHGEAVALMLPHVIRFNAVVVAACYEELLRATAATAGGPSEGAGFPAAEGIEGLARFIERVREHAGLAGRLAECGVERDRLSQLAEEAAKQWTGTFNPRDLTPADWLQLYEQAW